MPANEALNIAPGEYQQSDDAITDAAQDMTF